MPIIQCACGMVMSLSAEEPRHRCIRCGGVELRRLDVAEHRSRIDVGGEDCPATQLSGVSLAGAISPSA